MKTQDFSYELPDELIARYPTAERSASRLLVVQEEGVEHRHFRDICEYLKPGDLLVFNDTRVINARLFGRKPTGGKIEILLERIVDDRVALAHMKSSKTPKPGSVIILDDDTELEVLGRQGALFELQFPEHVDIHALLDKVGHVPLPPYMERGDELEDKERYQTVYSAKPGAVAAPTAGLHFDDALLEKIKNLGIDFGFVTLHVGAGTFQPVRVDNVKEHVMHSELIYVDEGLCEQVRACQARGGRVVAVGTTSVRSLETAAKAGELAPYTGDTDIFIYPGFEFKVVDKLITNFHLPESTLMMLVAAFAGKERIMNAYHKAVEEEYRFFSYGDSMLLSRDDSVASTSES